MNRPTLKDVAKQAGVSYSTVSRVVNNKGYISTQTREQVEQAVRDLGYSPNLAARNLQQQSTGLIGVTSPMLYRGFGNHYFGTVLQSAADAISDAGKTVLLSIMPDTDEPPFLRTVIANHLLDGLILIDSTIDLTYLPTLLSYDLPVVFVGRRPDVHSVGPDNFAGAVMAADYLYAQGCQRIVALYGPVATNYSAHDRKAGFETGVEAYGIPRASVWAGYADHKAELAQELMSAYLHDRPDAVFAGDANTTAGVMRALDAASIRVPDDLIVVGFSGHMIDESWANQVVSVALPLEAIGQKAVDVLVDVLANPPDVPVHVLLKPELIA